MEKSIKKIFRKSSHVMFIFLQVMLPLITLAQIQGTIHDNKNQPISFANAILIHQNDSSVVTGVMATDVGTFSIAIFSPGKYLIKTSMLGYKPAISQPFEVKSPNDHIHVNPIIVEEASSLINDVEIIAKKPMYEQKIDRLVVNVENSITSTGTTALEVLEKSPGIIVNRQNKTLSLGGKEGVMVMINGKESRMPISAAIEMLNGMSADNVTKIELITNPPSRYEAEGDAGIINVVLKKDDDFGTNGTYTFGAGLGIDGKLNGSVTINHHVKRINYFGMYSSSYDNSYQVIQMKKLVTLNGLLNETISESRREPLTNYQNARFGLDYTISSKTILGFLASGYISDWKMDARNNISYKTDNQITTLISQNITESNRWNNYMGNFNLQHVFKEDETLEFNADYLHYDDNNPSKYSIQYRDLNDKLTAAENIDVTKKTPINTYVAKLDYTGNMDKKLKIEAGIKSTHTSFENNVSVANRINNVWTYNHELTNNYSLAENISAAYSSLNYKFSEKTSMIAGLRYEYTNTVLSTAAQHGIIDRHYGQLFPTFFLSQELNKKNTLQFSYSRRITRPSFNELAPFVIFQSPDTYVAGNEKLQPSIIDIFKSDYKYNSVLFSISYSNENNAIRRFQPKQDVVKNILYLLSRNLDHVSTYSVLLSFPLKLTRWWNMQNNINGIMQNIRTDYDGKDLDISLKNFNLNLINNFRIIDGFTGELSAFYQSPSLWGIYKSKAISSVSVGLQKKSKNEKNTFTLNISDVFNTSQFEVIANVPELNIYNSTMLNFEPRVLRLTYTHNFGSKKVKDARKRESGSEEERKRVE